MTKCIRCHVNIAEQHLHCPLCGHSLKEEKSAQTTYPDYTIHYKKVNRISKEKIFLFLSISVVMVALTINLLTLNLNSVFWSVIVGFGIFYLWIVIKGTLLAKNHIGKRLLYHYIWLALFFFVIDLCLGFEQWSTNYTIPLLGMGATFLMTLIALWKRSLWQDDIGYIFAMFFINLCPMLLFIFNLSSVIWPTIATMVYSLITIIGMIIFSDKQFKAELVKRFHFR
ncbi:hypothetical protein BFR40_06370 [Brochothrix thermosphacta]|uniref:DUF6320 domain-containing protein n=1 Tax=Brochothrix thermosphacta TaxID=2756 RepID=UPI00083F59A6|nr:DUF6320 domain-containing protein [Brochothrix thermosphacta]ODJ51625.1 hypothetical protein BFR40_06370 [Brochothrix thermosphacta]